MPRDSSGNYTLPAGNPVVDGSVIETTWANPTMTDIAAQLNNVLTRDGVLGPVQPVLFVDGTVAAPGISFASDTDTGFYRPAINTVAVAAGGVEAMVWNVAGIAVSLPITFDAPAVFNDTITFTGGIIGIIKLPDGAAGAPSLAFADDLDTGMWSPAANTIAWSTNALERLRLSTVSTVASLSLNSVLTSAPLVVARLGTEVAIPVMTTGTTIAIVSNSAPSTGGYMSIQTGNTGSGGVNFGDTDGDSRGWVRYSHSADALRLGSVAVDGAWLDDNSRFLVNSNGTSYTATAFTTPVALQVASILAGKAGLGMATFAGATATGARLFAMKSRGATLGSMTVAGSSDEVLQIAATASDGTDFIRVSSITLSVEGAPAAGFVPGRISFSTAPVGGSVLERMRISATGLVTIQTPEALTHSLTVEQVVGADAIRTNMSIGGDASWRLSNTGTAANAASRLTIETASTTSGDPMVTLITPGITFTLGIDNSDSDIFKISRNSALGTSDTLEIRSSTGAVFINAPSSAANTLDLDALSGNFGIVQTQAIVGADVKWLLQNTDNTNTLSNAFLQLLTGGSAGGDPYILFGTGVTNYAMGQDNSDDDNFVISETSGPPGANNRFKINRSSNLCESGTTVPTAQDDLSFATTEWVRDYAPSAVFTPTYTNGANVAASGHLRARYIRVGDVVFVEGAVNISVTTTGVLTTLDISLPIASALANTSDVTGVMVRANAASVVTPPVDTAGIGANIGSDRATMSWSPTPTATTPLFYNFSYPIL